MTATDWYLLGLASGLILTLVTVSFCVVALLPDIAIKRKR